jgi:IS5 family transposase
MAKPRDDRQKDLLWPALEDIIDLGHPLVRLAREIDWGFLDSRFASVCTPGTGQPPLPTRLVAEAHARPVGRGAVPALAGEPLLPILLR